MKLINSPVRNVAPDTTHLISRRSFRMASKPHSIAAEKKIARKRERAMLRNLADKELLQELHLDNQEKRERAAYERTYAYQVLMNNLSRYGRKHSSRKNRNNSVHRAVEVEEKRLEYRVNVLDEMGNPKLVASCAMA